ncbi:MAG: septal ring lytic transglycosylase RlpA family protein [Acidobacteria bacterium]|nr:septal ring lytic transglycosylase RlpA family protein [Acidobacteriota bacterium]
MKRLFAAVVCTAGLALLGCESDGPTEVQADSIAEASAATGTISSDKLAELKDQFPVLRKEPAPPPQPRPSANPADIPGAIADALSPAILEEITGTATFYADKFEGRRTASGIPFRQNQMVAAHRAYPFGTVLRVTNVRNHKSVNVRVVDRGPFAKPKRASRPVLDLSRRAAEQLDFISAGRAEVRVQVLEWGKGIS